MSTKFYAVKKGLTPGIYTTWEECKNQVHQYSGAVYKSFKTLDEAKAFLDDSAPNAISDSDDVAIAYVDGSYEHSLSKYAFGCVFLLPNGTVYVENGSGNNPDSAKLRNVTGEMLGAMFAVRFGIKNGFSGLEIRYDYEGVEKWVTGAWKSKTELTQKYAEAMRRWNRQTISCVSMIGKYRSSL